MCKGFLDKETCKEIFLEDSMATHSSIRAWEITWTEEPGRLQSMGLQRVGHDWSDLTCTQKWLDMHSCKETSIKKHKISQHLYACVTSHFSRVQLFVTRQIAACQAPLSMGFSVKNTGVGCHALLQGIFLVQGSNPHLLCLLHSQTDSLPLSHLEMCCLTSPIVLFKEMGRCQTPKCARLQVHFLGVFRVWPHLPHAPV